MRNSTTCTRLAGGESRIDTLLFNARDWTATRKKTITDTRRGTFIVLEGLDGAGKTKQARSLYQRLKRRGLRVMLTREPGGTRIGKLLRRLIVDGRHVITPETELLLIAAARAQLVRQVIEPWLRDGGVVVSDRFTPSTWAYQGGGRGLSTDQIRPTIGVASAGLQPDLVILLDIGVGVGLRRKAASGGMELSRFENESTDFLDRVRTSYLEQARQSPERWLVLDAELPARALSDQIWRVCLPLVEDLHSNRIALADESGIILTRSKERGDI